LWHSRILHQLAKWFELDKSTSSAEHPQDDERLQMCCGAISGEDFTFMNDADDDCHSCSIHHSRCRRICADSSNLNASEIRTAAGFRRLAAMAFVVFVLGGTKRSAVFNLHSIPPAIIEAKRFSLSTIRRKRSRIGSMRRSEILQA
jgi:hypothetical protein